MKRLLALLVVPLLLLVLAPAPQAGAHYLPPGQWFTWTDSNCRHAVIYGNFGDGFAQMEFQTEGCNIYSTVEVTTAHAGHTHVQPCSLGAAIFNPAPHCFFTGPQGGPTGHTTIQVQVHGTALKVRTLTYPGPITLSHGVFE